MISQTTFHSQEALEQALKSVAREAMEKTLSRMKNELKSFIEEDVYSYSPHFNVRTNYLINNYENIFEEYYWNDFGKGVGGGLRPNLSVSFTSNIGGFSHGNPTYGALNLPSYLEIMNNPDLVGENPFNFPTGDELGRGQFWDDFVKWAEDNYAKIFQEEYEKLI